MEPNVTCPQCHAVNPATNYFCPNCGKKLKNKPIETTIRKQILIYAVSVLLPPFGLRWAVPLLMQKDTKSKIVGLVSLTLTIVSLVLSIKIFSDMLTATTEQLNQFNSLGF